MDYAEFKEIIFYINPGKNIVSGRRGSEENIKVKIIVPLLQFLGYDVVQDMDFERLSADIVLVDNNSQPILIVETKAWEQQITHYLNQCLEYTLKLKTPFIIISSGQQTCLYSSLINSDNLGDTKPIIEFTFNDLLGKNGQQTLEQLKLLVGKDNILNGAKLLHEKSEEQLPQDKTIEEAKIEFLDKANGFKSVIKSLKITDEDFKRMAEKHSKEVCDCMIFGKDEFYRIARENKNIRLRYRSREIGLEYLLASKPRSKIVGLGGIYPARARVNFGIEGWEELKCSPEILRKIKSFPRDLKTREQIEELVDLIETAIKEINEPK